MPICPAPLSRHLRPDSPLVGGLLVRHVIGQNSDVSSRAGTRSNRYRMALFDGIIASSEITSLNDGQIARRSILAELIPMCAYCLFGHRSGSKTLPEIKSCLDWFQSAKQCISKCNSRFFFQKKTHRGAHIEKVLNS